MQRKAQVVFNWVTENGLELNVRKTKAMIFDSTRNLAMLHMEYFKLKLMDLQFLA